MHWRRLHKGVVVFLAHGTPVLRGEVKANLLCQTFVSRCSHRNRKWFSSGPSVSRPAGTWQTRQLLTAFACAVKVWGAKTSTASFPQTQIVSDFPNRCIIEYKNILKIEFIN